jgi:hypothetical protein
MVSVCVCAVVRGLRLQRKVSSLCGVAYSIRKLIQEREDGDRKMLEVVADKRLIAAGASVFVAERRCRVSRLLENFRGERARDPRW